MKAKQVKEMFEATDRAEAMRKEREEKKPKLKLVGKDGNAFAVLAFAKDAAHKAKWSKERMDAFFKEAMSGDYNHLLATCMNHFDVY